MAKREATPTHRFWLSLVILLLSISIHADETTNVFEEQFNTEDDFNKWTIVNGDTTLTRTWIFYSQKDNGQARILKESSAAHDNWLISPMISLEKGKIYELSCYVYSGMYNKKESLRISMGTSTDTISQTIELLDLRDFVRGDETHMEKRFSVEEDGTFYLGFHAYSIANQGRIELDSIIIKELSIGAVPAAASSLTITPASEGKLAADISFITPTIKADSTLLTDISSVTILREDSLIYTFSNPQPGTTLSFTDEKAQQGFNTYTIFCHNSSGSSEALKGSAYVGLDVPTAVLSLEAKRKSDLNISLSWNTPEKSVNGGFFNPSDIEYKVVLDDDTIATTTECAYTFIPKEEIQRNYSFKVIPTVPFGCGVDTVANNLISGQPLCPPYKESFSDGKVSTAAWSQDSHVASFNWYPSIPTKDTTPLDEDNGLLMARAYYASNGERSRVMGPIFDLSKMKNAVLSFYLYKRKSEDIDFYGSSRDSVKVQLSIDGEEWQDINDASFSPYDNTSGWVKYNVPLPMVKSSNIEISFLSVLDSDWGTHHDFFIDSVSIDEAGFTSDLAIRLFSASTKRVNIGEETTFSAAVYNHGAAPAKAFDVVLYKNDTEISRQTSAELAPTETASFEFDYTSTLQDARNDSTSWKVAVEYSDDEIENNNTSDSIWWTVRMNDVQIPQNLSASKTSTSTISLNWDSCTSESGETAQRADAVTDDFESYTPFITDSIGEWTVIDADGGETLASPVIPIKYPHEGEPMAWQIFNTTDAGVVTEAHYDNVFQSHSGVQYIMCTSNDDYFKANDDWLISPKLDGEAQTISFFARTPSSASGADWIKVYCSTTDKHPDSFKQLGNETHRPIWDNWNSEAYTYELPDGARYFAIRAVRCFLYLMVDDVTYRPYNGDKPARTLLGYNIYRNGEKINTSLISDNSYTDSNADTNIKNVYYVTAVYEEGESNYSEPASVSATSRINGIDSGNSSARYFTIDGKHTQKPTKGISIVKTNNGKVSKIAVK